MAKKKTKSTTKKYPRRIPIAEVSKERRWGTPPKYSDPAVLQEKVNEYFSKCDEGETHQVVTPRGQVVDVKRQIPYTIQGLSGHLGFATRYSFYDYINANKHGSIENANAIANILLCAKQKIEEQRVKGGLTGEQNAKIVQLDLSCNFGYVNPQKLELTGKDGSPFRIDMGIILDKIDGTTRSLVNDKPEVLEIDTQKPELALIENNAGKD